jgi:DNA invertase Pin-like site-specific DNA recombinase
MPIEVPRAPACVDGYARVSRVGLRKGERFISPAVQEETIRQWAGARGVRVLEVFVELDESGGRSDRALLELAIRRVEDGISDGIAVAKLDRFGRSLVDGLRAIERIHRADGLFFAIQEGLDLTTDAGRLVLRIMLGMAEWEQDRTRSSWEVAKARAVARGVYMGSVAPVGYRRTRGGRLRPDPAVAPVIAEAFRLRADGASQRGVGRFLEASGVRTSLGNAGWTPAATCRLLGKRVYLGEVASGPYVREHAHPALVDAATWQLAQRPRLRAAPAGNRPALLRGLVRCASCGLAMSPTTGHTRGVRRFQYACRRTSAAGPCPEPASVEAHSLEALVEDVAFDLLQRRRRAPTEALRDAERRLEAREAALVRYRDSDRVLATLGETAFADGLKARHERARDARLDVAAARARLGVHALAATRGLERDWPTLTVAARNDVLAKVIDVVFVAPGRLNLDDRVLICPAGTAPTNLPQRGDRRRAPRTIHAQRRWIQPNTTPGAAIRWSPARLERELRAFLRGGTHWPTHSAFQRAGRERLHRQAVLQGGETYWAHRFGLAIDPKAVTWARWTDERIRTALRLFLADKTVFPPIKEFEAAGLQSLRNAITHTGGVRRWSDEMVIPRHSRCQGPRGSWTDDDIREVLDELCRGRTTFPTVREFKRAGLASLTATLYRQGTMQTWADRTGLPRASPGPRRAPRTRQISSG